MREADAWSEKREKSIHLVTTRLDEILIELDTEIAHLQAFRIGLASGSIPHAQFLKPTKQTSHETRVRMSTAQEKREANARKKSIHPFN
jgi:hypothetical protein